MLFMLIQNFMNRQPFRFLIQVCIAASNLIQQRRTIRSGSCKLFMRCIIYRCQLYTCCVAWHRPGLVYFSSKTKIFTLRCKSSLNTIVHNMCASRTCLSPLLLIFISTDIREPSVEKKAAGSVRIPIQRFHAQLMLTLCQINVGKPKKFAEPKKRTWGFIRSRCISGLKTCSPKTSFIKIERIF